MPENETKVLEFEPREWKDDKEGGTPIDALTLNRMEQGIADVVKGVNDVNLNLMTYLVESDGETATLDINGRPMPAPCYIFDKAEMVTWFDSGVEGEERVKPFPSQADMQEVRDSLGQLHLHQCELFVWHNPEVEGDITFQVLTSRDPYVYYEFSVRAAGQFLAKRGPENLVYADKPW